MIETSCKRAHLDQFADEDAPYTLAHASLTRADNQIKLLEYIRGIRGAGVVVSTRDSQLGDPGSIPTSVAIWHLS